MELERKTFVRLHQKASQARHTERPSLATLRVDWAGKCQSPVPREWHSYSGRRSRREKTLMVGPGGRSFNRVEALVPCRKCTACLNRRKLMWAERMIAEYRVSARTWAGALTFSPDVHLWATNVARLQMQANGDDFDAAAVDQQFAARHRILSQEVTRYIKRVRELSGVPMRLVVVVEAHKTNLPHYHMLAHECDLSQPLRKRLLDKSWRGGYCHWRLVKDEAQCAYLAKYLSKDTAGKIRASLNYGAVTPPVVF